MRIKCPNSDIFLELPGDRTDMKFTCPACHKVHRVTVNITTPGEDPPPQPQTRSVTRTQPQLPKKYATGAYPPVVDIPIDANFVLLDGRTQSAQPGIDLSNAADPAGRLRVDRNLSQRKTEVYRHPEEDEQPRSGGPSVEVPSAGTMESVRSDDETRNSAARISKQEEPGIEAADEPAKPDARPEGRKLWDEVPESPAPSSSTSSSVEKDAPRPNGEPPDADADETAVGDDESAAFGAGPGGGATGTRERGHARAAAGAPGANYSGKRRRSSRGKLLVPLLLVVAAAGLLVWEQIRFSHNRETVAANLAWAGSAWQKGEIDEAAGFARDAQSALVRSDDFLTAGNLYNRAAAWSGLFPPRDPENREAATEIGLYFEREQIYHNFLAAIDPTNFDQLAAEVRTASTEALKDGDAPLADAMQMAAVKAAMDHIRRGADRQTPEDNARLAVNGEKNLAPVLGDTAKKWFGDETRIFYQTQATRLIDQSRDELSLMAADASTGNAGELKRYGELSRRLRDIPSVLLDARPDLAKPLPELAIAKNRDAIGQLMRLCSIVEDAVGTARTVLGQEEPEETMLDSHIERAKKESAPSPEMSAAAVRNIEDALKEADLLFSLQMELYSRMQSEMRLGRSNAGTKLGWSMLRVGFGDPKVAIDPAGFRYDGDTARMSFVFDGVPAVMEMKGEDYDDVIRARMAGYTFTAGWTHLFHKPLVLMASLAGEMREAGVSAADFPDWEVFEGPGVPLALTRDPTLAVDTAMASPASGVRRVFFDKQLYAVKEVPPPADSLRMVEDFRRAAERLHDGVMGDISIPPSIRQALKPILEGAYQTPDPRDFIDSSFCRRLIEADYLETYIEPMPPERQKELDEYRSALGKMEAGYDEFVVDLGGGGRLFAVAQLDADVSGDGKASDQDPETGESRQRYTWRLEKGDETVFFSPLPARFLYSFLLAEYYDGAVMHRPVGKPKLTEVWHAMHGKVASYRSGAARAEGDAELWNKAIAGDLIGRVDQSIGAPGWNFPLHVLERDDQGDPLVLATLSGTVKSPDFSQYTDDAARLAAEDQWLDSTAATLSTPGELGLIFHQFFRYCSDSPLPELPNLIGSHYGLSDTHQTVYQSLERRWVGRLIGDCDDLAEVFQVLTRRQGKLSHVMHLPGHAAAGYVEPIADVAAGASSTTRDAAGTPPPEDAAGGDETAEEDKFRFVVLQTGPVQQFTAPTIKEAVDIAYRSFDRSEGMSHMTTDAVPLLLRFADEETRTPFVLSARIYEDAAYADTMITVQGYWHEHAYSAAIKVMEKMVQEDKDIGNVKELGSLYERVGLYEKSGQLRRQEFDLVRNNPSAALSTMLEMVMLHFQEKDRSKALAALGDMETIMQDMIRRDDAPEFFRAMSFRSMWAIYLSRLDQPARAWNLVRQDAAATKRQIGRVSDPVLRTMVILYERLCMKRAADAGRLSSEDERALSEIRREIEDSIYRGYFKSDDGYNTTIDRYFTVGRFAVADIGRERGLERLKLDGPYPDAAKDQTKRSRNVDAEDWKWLRITPQLYLALGQEMLDPDEFPELYDPAAAKPILEFVERAIQKGTGLGSDVAGGDDSVKSALTLAFLNRDLASFKKNMAEVMKKDYSSLYDDAAMTFGLQCGLIPLSEFPAWIREFHSYFPGTQHYFKVVYRAIDKEHYDHALMMAEATARYFPGHQLLVQEAEFVKTIIPQLKAKRKPALSPTILNIQPVR